MLKRISKKSSKFLSYFGIGFFYLFFLQIFVLSLSDQLLGQSSPDRRYIFEEDNPEIEKLEQKHKERVLKTDQAADTDLDFKAPQIEYLQEKKVMKGSGGVLVSRQGMQVQADQAEANLESKDVKLSGDVVFTWPQGEVVSDTANLNIDSERGSFEEAELELEEGDYLIEAGQLYKDSDIDYRFFDAALSTCHCADQSKPWKIECSKGSLQDDGYAHTYNARFSVYDVPILYSPYFVIPVKRTRQSGILAPTYGYSSEDGIQFSLPYYGVIDDYSEFILTPFTEVKTRTGASLSYLRRFSRASEVKTRWYYSDESARDGDLRGTNVDNLSDPTFDQDRFGGFLKHGWQSDSTAVLPTRLNTDIHYVSDDLFLREIRDSDIGERGDRFVTSQMLMQNSLGSSVFTEFAGEYNQAMEIDDDRVFQRLPELALNARHAFRPFGFNPYGLKFVTGMRGVATDFVRKDGYDGWRYDLNPSIKIPYHFQNYLSNDLTIDMHQTYYNQANDIDPVSGEAITGDNRRAFQFVYTTSTALERVYDVPNDGLLRYMTSLGASNQGRLLERVKHVVEPFVRYRYTPATQQNDLPLYDSLDRFRHRSLVTYGFRTSLLGRFSSLQDNDGSIDELTPDIEDLPTLDPGFGLSEEDVFSRSRGAMFRQERGRINELMYLSMAQSYDYIEDQNNEDPNREAYSDVGIETGFNPSSYFGFSFDGNLDTQNSNFSSWGVGTQFRDDRGDILRAHYTFIDNNISQLDGNLELVLTDRLKLGLFGRFDDLESEFIESQVVLRFGSSCNCWYVDVGYADTINPDKQQGMIKFTFLGLGDLVQSFSLDRASSGAQ